MLFAIDYDDTWSKAPIFFNKLVDLIEQNGHSAIIATLRFENTYNKDLEEDVKNRIPVVYCGHSLKRNFVESKGYKVDIWIDDTPELIGNYDLT